MINQNNGNTNIHRNDLKRSVSPDYSSIDIQKCKAAKLELQRNDGNKENLITRTQSEMMLSKHTSFIMSNEEDSDDIPWHRSHLLWSNMMAKTFDKTYYCPSNFLDSHPCITTKMRSVLFDWLIEVSEVYQLHRETYHLSIAYIDQYLCNTNNLPKQKFQLLGVTSLFVAAKIEEIYPPRLYDFAYVTDNTCSEEDILDMELALMNVLKWYIDPITSISWLLIYLQAEYEINSVLNYDGALRKTQRLSLSNSDILQNSRLTKVHRSSNFLKIFPLAVRLLDICSFDIEYSQYSKNVLAASAILLYQSIWPLKEVAGLIDDDLLKCQQWMRPFYEVLEKSSSNLIVRSSLSVPAEEAYSIQIHNVSIDLLVNVNEKRTKFVTSIMNNQPFRDLLNHLSWPSKSLRKENDEEQQEETNGSGIIV